MSSRLPVDCLVDILENLEEDKVTLHSCLLVNRLWCKVSVSILWRDIWEFKYSFPYGHQHQVVSPILNTLFACLPNESKELLYQNDILISTSPSKQPLFNYVEFCRVLSIDEIYQMVCNYFDNQSINLSISKTKFPLY